MHGTIETNRSEIEQARQATTEDRDYAFVKVTVADDVSTYTAELDDEDLARRVESGWSVTRAWMVSHIAGSTESRDLTNLVAVKQYIRGRR